MIDREAIADEQNLFRAIRAKNRFLNRYPKLRPYQEEIDKALKKAGSSHNRMVVLNGMVHDKLHKLKKALIELQKKMELLK